MVPWWGGVFALEVPNISKPKVWLDDFSRLGVYPSSMQTTWTHPAQPLKKYEWNKPIISSFQKNSMLTTLLALGGVRFFPLCPFKPGRKTNKGVREQWSKFWLFAVYRGLYYPCYIGIIISQCKDHYWPTRISWNVTGGFWSLLSLSDALMWKNWMIHAFFG